MPLAFFYLPFDRVSFVAGESFVRARQKISPHQLDRLAVCVECGYLLL